MRHNDLAYASNPSDRSRNRFECAVLGIGWGLLLYASAQVSASAGDLAVIVNTECSVTELSRDQVINIFLGRQRQLPDGTRVLAVDLLGPNNEKARFYEGLVDKKLSEINSYWARLVFSGRGSPPWQAESSTEVREIVASQPGAIGYIERGQVRPGVRIVYSVTD